jgi:predicted methyltransferase
MFIVFLPLLCALVVTPAKAQTLPRPQREVASVVSPIWADEASRDRAGEADKVIRALGIGPGQTVADIGAGSGYYTVRVSKAVGPTGTVIAQDIMPSYINGLKDRVRRAGLTNVRFVRGSSSDPRLAPASVDVALMIHMYHEIARPYDLLYRLRASLKPGGQIAIVDLDRAAEAHGMPKSLLACEVKAVGYSLISMTDLNPGYLAIFKPSAPVDPRSVKACRG